MAESVCIGCDELSWAARWRAWTAQERDAFMGLDQDGRNAWVRSLAEEADGLIATEDRRGTDGVVYTAFWLQLKVVLILSGLRTGQRIRFAVAPRTTFGSPQFWLRNARVLILRLLQGCPSA